MQPTHRNQHWLVVALILMGVVSRLVPHAWNFSPVMAIALFAGALLPRWWGPLLTLAIVAISDVFLGWHSTVPYTWGAFLLTAMLGGWLRRAPTPGRIFTGALAGSILFFLITNFGVWVEGLLYPRTLDGLQQCFVAAIPFFRNSLLSDLVFTAAFFGGYALVSRAVPARASALR